MLLPKLDSECGAGSNTGSDIDKTFEIEGDGIVQVIDGNGKVLMEHKVDLISGTY